MCVMTPDESGRVTEPRTSQEWFARIMQQFDALDAMIEDTKTILRESHRIEPFGKET